MHAGHVGHVASVPDRHLEVKEFLPTNQGVRKLAGKSCGKCVATLEITGKWFSKRKVWSNPLVWKLFTTFPPILSQILNTNAQEQFCIEDLVSHEWDTTASGSSALLWKHDSYVCFSSSGPAKTTSQWHDVVGSYEKGSRWREQHLKTNHHLQTGKGTHNLIICSFHGLSISKWPHLWGKWTKTKELIKVLTMTKFCCKDSWDSWSIRREKKMGILWKCVGNMMEIPLDIPTWSLAGWSQLEFTAVATLNIDMHTGTSVAGGFWRQLLSKVHKIMGFYSYI